MNKDIPNLKVEDLAICIVPSDSSNDLWDCFILNLQEEAIHNVLIVSRGYGTDLEGFRRQTTTLRHFFEKIDPLDIQTIEPVFKQLFTFTNEYWVSFTQNGHMFDKKYIFVVGSIEPVNFTLIPFLNRRGVMIR
jgi:hypothetical protein